MTRAWWLSVALAIGCGDDRAGVDAAITLSDAPGEAAVTGDLFGDSCTQPAFPQIGLCRDGEGACTDEGEAAVCRPFCTREGMPQCAARMGVERVTDRGSCVCVPP